MANTQVTSYTCVVDTTPTSVKTLLETAFSERNKPKQKVCLLTLSSGMPRGDYGQTIIYTTTDDESAIDVMTTVDLLYEQIMKVAEQTAVANYKVISGIYIKPTGVQVTFHPWMTSDIIFIDT